MSDPRDAIIRALAHELALSREKEVVDFNIDINNKGHSEICYRVLIHISKTGVLVSPVEFYKKDSIIVDLNDQLLFDQTRKILGFHTETVAVTFSGNEAKLVLGHSNGYRYENIQYVIAKAISRGIVKFAEENGMKITRVDRLEVPDPSVYLADRGKRRLLRN